MHPQEWDILATDELDQAALGITKKFNYQHCIYSKKKA